MSNYNIISFQDKFLTRKEAAQFLGVKENTLAVWACTKRKPIPMFKVGKYVKYKIEDLQKFIDNCEVK